MCAKVSLAHYYIESITVIITDIDIISVIICVLHLHENLIFNDENKILHRSLRNTITEQFDVLVFP